MSLKGKSPNLILISINFISNAHTASRKKSEKSTKKITANGHNLDKYPRPTSRVILTFNNKNPKIAFPRKTTFNITLLKFKRPSITIVTPMKVATFCRLSTIPDLKKKQVLISHPKAPKKLLK
jgi:hypothetical protein